MSLDYYPKIRFDLAAGADGTDQFVLNNRCVIRSAKLVDVNGIATDAANFVKFDVLGSDGATVLYTWSTETGQEGVIAASTSISLVDQSPSDGDLYVFDPDVVYSVIATQSGAGKLVASSIILQLDLARDEC